MHRVRLFRLAAVILGPLLAFGGLELGLRVVGYGYPTSFFLRTRINGHDIYVPNAKFTYRFFSPALARPVPPVGMRADKSTNAYRIFLFGESAAAGDPDSSYGVSRYLEVLLRERFPHTDFQVLCVALTGINSHTILPIARECACHEGDLWLIYMGNNEMIGPFGAETVFGMQAPLLSLARASLAVKTTRLGQLMDAAVERLGHRSLSPKPSDGMQIGLRESSPPADSPSRKAWGGMQMFTQARLRHDAPARLRAYANFRSNLEDILGAGRRAGVPIILSTVAVNLKDCAPFASVHRTGLTADEETAWNQANEEGVALEGAGSYQAALARYLEGARIDSDYADLQFRIGTCELALTHSNQARRSFALARDYDALAFRADTTINQAIRTAAVQDASRGVHLVDAERTFEQRSPAGIPGAEFFYEHVHLNFEGNYLLALSFAEQVRQLLPNSIRARDIGAWASAEVCERRLAVTVWDRQRVWQPIFNRISFPPFTGQLNHAASFKVCEAKLAEAKAQMSFQTPEQARQIYEQALALAPGDNLLHGNFEQFLEAGGNLAQALAEAERVCSLVPYLPGPWFYTGTLLVRQGRIREAEECFGRAVAIRSDYAQAHNELGLIRAGQQRTAEAIACFKRALRADPTFAESYLNLGLVEQRHGRLDQAMSYYAEAANLQPQGPADYLNHGVALAASGRSAEAVACLQTLIQQVPGMWQARYQLGMELAAEGRSDEAQMQFSQVVRYRPDFAQLLPNVAGAHGERVGAAQAQSP
jgi:tetratricopeptide (TPR) repeat protein